MPTASRLAVITCIWITVVVGLVSAKEVDLLDSAKETGFGFLDSGNKTVQTYMQ